MAYTVYRSDGSVLTTVGDQQIVKDASPLALVGRASLNYGRVHAENYVHILENFASDTPPETPLLGQFWYDRSTSQMNAYGEGGWRPLPVATLNDGGFTTVGTVPIDADTDVLIEVCGDLIVSATSAETVGAHLLPAAVRLHGKMIEFAARFPNGIRAGVNLATDAAGYVFNGKIAGTDKAGSIVAGSPIGAATIVQIGAATVIVFVSSGRVGAVWSHNSMASGLPANITLDGTNFAFSSRFPAGIISGLTFATDADVTYAISGYATQSSVSSAVSALGTARASAIDEVKTWADSQSAIASRTTQLIAEFTSATGTSTIAQAANSLMASASADEAVATEIAAVKSTFTSGTGTSTVAQAAQQLKTSADAGQAASTSLNTLSSALTNATGQTTAANAIQQMWTKANETQTVAGWGVEVNAGNQVAGLQLIADGAQKKSEVQIKADSFKLWAPGSPEITPFEIVDNKVYMKSATIGDLTIGDQKIAPNAISSTAVYRAAQSVRIPQGTEVEIGSLSYTKQYSDSIIIVRFGINYNTARSDIKGLIQPTVNGSPLTPQGWNMLKAFASKQVYPINTDTFHNTNTFQYTDALIGYDAGPMNFVFKAYNRAYGSSYDAHFNVFHRVIVITEIKR